MDLQRVSSCCEARRIERFDWSQELKAIRREGMNMRLRLRDWPLFERHEVLPHGIKARRYRDWDAVSAQWAEGAREETWPVEVVAWWRTPDIEGHLAMIRAGRIPRPPSGPDLYDREHITGGAKVTCQSLWLFREDWDKAMAVWVYAWCKDALNHDSRQSRYETTREGDNCIMGLMRAAGEKLGDDRQDWHWRHARVCGEIQTHDPVTWEARVLSDKCDVIRAFLNDIHRVQTSWARLVHLALNPAFDPEVFKQREAERIAVLRAEHEAEHAAWQERLRKCQVEEERQERALRAEEERQERAWRDELIRREANKKLNKGSGVKGAARAMGVSMGCLQNWIRKGLSQAQIQWLAARPKGTHRGKPIDVQLREAGLIPGLEPDRQGS